MDEMSFADIEYSKQTVCYKCGTKESSHYGFDIFTKKLICWECTSQECLASGIEQDEETLSVEYRLRRMVFTDALKSLFSKIQSEDYGDEINRVEKVLWIEARSINEYEDMTTVVRRIRKVLAENM